MKQTVCSFCHGLLEEPCTEKHIQQYQHVTQMSQVEPWEYPSTTASQSADWLCAGWGWGVMKRPRQQAVEHKELLLYPVQIIINLTVYETHCGGRGVLGGWAEAYTKAKNAHPVRNLTGVRKSLQPGLMQTPTLSKVFNYFLYHKDARAAVTHFV